MTTDNNEDAQRFSDEEIKALLVELDAELAAGFTAPKPSEQFDAEPRRKKWICLTLLDNLGGDNPPIYRCPAGHLVGIGITSDDESKRPPVPFFFLATTDPAVKGPGTDDDEVLYKVYCLSCGKVAFTVVKGEVYAEEGSTITIG